MKKKFTEEQIAFALKQAETGTPVVEVNQRISDVKAALKMGIQKIAEAGYGITTTESFLGVNNFTF